MGPPYPNIQLGLRKNEKWPNMRVSIKRQKTGRILGYLLTLSNGAKIGAQSTSERRYIERITQTLVKVF